MVGTAFLRHSKSVGDVYDFFVNLDPRRNCVRKVDETSVMPQPPVRIPTQPKQQQQHQQRGIIIEIRSSQLAIFVLGVIPKNRNFIPLPPNKQSDEQFSDPHIFIYRNQHRKTTSIRQETAVDETIRRRGEGDVLAGVAMYRTSSPWWTWTPHNTNPNHTTHVTTLPSLDRLHRRRWEHRPLPVDSGK